LYFLLILSTVIMVEPARSQLSLQYAEPSDVLFTVDSIPGDNREKVVLSYQGPDGRLEAHWVVVLLNSPYDSTRTVIRDVVQNAFKIDAEREITVDVENQPDVNRHKPTDPIYGDGFADFQVIGTPVTGAREYRVETKPYNQVGRNRYSRSAWRLIDCRPLFRKDCAIVVVSRVDHSREWTWMHPGIPLPWKQQAITRLVTDKEVAVIQKIAMRLGQPVTQAFVPYVGYKTSGVVNMMKDIAEAAKALPQPGSSNFAR
jgi:hypothetical protein